MTVLNAIEEPTPELKETAEGLELYHCPFCGKQIHWNNEFKQEDDAFKVEIHDDERVFACNGCEVLWTMQELHRNSNHVWTAAIAYNRGAANLLSMSDNPLEAWRLESEANAE